MELMEVCIKDFFFLFFSKATFPFPDLLAEVGLAGHTKSFFSHGICHDGFLGWVRVDQVLQDGNLQRQYCVLPIV